MTDAEGVVGAFAATWKAGNTVLHAQSCHAGAPSGEHLVCVSLVADVPDQSIFGCVESIVKRDGPRLDDRWPPVLETDSIRKSRNSRAS